MSDTYINGTYLSKSPTWHVEDSPWKATQIIKMLKNTNLCPKTVCDVGCGAGEVLNQLYGRYSSTIHYCGYEISPQAYEMCKSREKENLQFFLKDFSQEERHFDLILLIDVIEHVDDLYGFLRKIKDKGCYKLFHIPLDLFALNLLTDNLTIGLDHPGHIHFFTKNVALKILKNNNYDIIDFFYTQGFLLNKKTLAAKFAYPIRKLAYHTDSDLLIKIFGGVSLLVLTK